MFVQSSFFFFLVNKKKCRHIEDLQPRASQESGLIVSIQLNNSVRVKVKQVQTPYQESHKVLNLHSSLWFIFAYVHCYLFETSVCKYFPDL